METRGTKWTQLAPSIQQLQASMHLRFRSRSLPVQVLCGVCGLEAELFHNSIVLEVFPALTLFPLDSALSHACVVMPSHAVGNPVADLQYDGCTKPISTYLSCS